MRLKLSVNNKVYIIRIGRHESTYLFIDVVTNIY
nr:MAG TPA: hypothetical protein [Caudoviricetes sp.]